MTDTQAALALDGQGFPRTSERNTKTPEAGAPNATPPEETDPHDVPFESFPPELLFRAMADALERLKNFDPSGD